MSTPFAEINFGYASAERESTDRPQLLLEGYFDYQDIVHEAQNGPRFLFLGYKGSGKSALCEHLRLKAKKNSQMFVTRRFLNDFPYSDFKRIIHGDYSAQEKYPTAWSWLLLITLFDSFARDEGASTQSDLDFIAAKRTLNDLGLLPEPELRQIVIASAKRSFKLAIPQFLETNLERNTTEQGAQIPLFVERLRLIARNFRSSNKHLLIIDGLDDILIERNVQFESLAGLILEVARLNLLFSDSGAPVKIIVLCRTDIYERLPLANKNKIRQDSALYLDWYSDPKALESSGLFQLVNLKSRVTDPTIDDVFSRYLPAETNFKNTSAFIFDHTRHTPRDLIQALSHIQKFADSYSASRNQVFSGLRSYSQNYFFPEIKDEMVGYMSDEAIEDLLRLIASFHSRTISFSKLQQRTSSNPRYSSLDLEAGLEILFECSAIGNIRQDSRGVNIHTFKYRNRSSAFSFEESIMVHRGLWKALNIV